jgi:integrase
MKKFKVRKYKHPRLKFVLNYREDGERKRKFFETEAAAKAEAAKKNAELKKSGREGAEFPSRLRVMAQECAERLLKHGKTIAEATDFLIAHLKATEKSCNASELVKELLAAKEAGGASGRYLSDLKHRLNRFSDHFNGQVVATITSKQTDDWLRGLKLAPVTRNNFRRVLRVMFNYAKGRDYCTSNPADATAKAKEVESPVGILTVKETARLLNAATEETLPYFAIGAFAGLRAAELARLDWSDVGFKSRLIEVRGNAKSASRRFVKIRPNLAAWLAPYRLHTGSVLPVNARKKLEAVRKTAKLLEDWPANALRHGFGSYHLPAFNDAAALALEMGHTGTKMIFGRYREVVKPAEAAKFWKIKPEAEQARGKVVAFAAKVAA